MLKPGRSMLSPFPLMCWKQQLLYFFFNGRKMAVKAISEVHRHCNDIQIWSLHFSTDCAGKMPLRLSIYDKKNKFKLTKRRGIRKTIIWNVWEHPKVFAWMPLWSGNLYDVGTIRTNEHRDVAASEISLVTLLFHYIPLCHHSEWLVLIMQMSQRKEARVIITVVDRLWGENVPSAIEML